MGKILATTHINTLKKKNRENLHFYLSILCFGFCFNSFSVRRFVFHIGGTNQLLWIPTTTTTTTFKHKNNKITTHRSKYISWIPLYMETTTLMLRLSLSLSLHSINTTKKITRSCILIRSICRFLKFTNKRKMPETIGLRHYGVIRIHICCSKESMHTSVNSRNLKNGSVSILRLLSISFFGLLAVDVLFFPQYFMFSVLCSFHHSLRGFSAIEN